MKTSKRVPKVKMAWRAVGPGVMRVPLPKPLTIKEQCVQIGLRVDRLQARDAVAMDEMRSILTRLCGLSQEVSALSSRLAVVEKGLILGMRGVPRSRRRAK